MMKIILVILAAVVIFMGIRAVRMGSKYLLMRYPDIKNLGRIITAGEFIIWIIFIFGSTTFLLKDQFFYKYIVACLILIILGSLTWFYFREIVAGYIFKMRYSLKNGTYISAGDHYGQIKSQHLSYIKLKTSEGVVLNIPYSRIISKVLTEAGSRGTSEEHVMMLQVDLSLGKNNAGELIRNALFSLPWYRVKEEPIIKFVSESSQGYMFEVKLVSVKDSNIKLIESALDKVKSLHVMN